MFRNLCNVSFSYYFSHGCFSILNHALCLVHNLISVQISLKLLYFATNAHAKHVVNFLCFNAHLHTHTLGSYLCATVYFCCCLVWYQMFKIDDWAPLSAFNIFFHCNHHLIIRLKINYSIAVLVLPSWIDRFLPFSMV